MVRIRGDEQTLIKDVKKNWNGKHLNLSITSV